MNGIELMAAERKRQIESEGWTPEHDDEHVDGELALAAACYAEYSVEYDAERNCSTDVIPLTWPWAVDWWKPGQDNSNASRIRELVKAGALIAAEIDRLLRKDQTP